MIKAVEEKEQGASGHLNGQDLSGGLEGCDWG